MNGMITMTASGGNAMGGLFSVVWILALVAMMYFMMIRPQRKEQNRIQNMLSSMEVGDSVVTTSGFYGKILDLTDEDVIVEFGNNKNCRIPMRKTAIAEVEKAADAVAVPEAKTEKKEEKPLLDDKAKKGVETLEGAAEAEEEK